MKKQNGFTLIELISVFLILTIIMGIAGVTSAITLMINRRKTDTVVVSNIEKTIGDFIIEKNLSVVPNNPLYFSVGSLVKTNILTENANVELARILNDSNPTDYFVKATRNASNEDLKYEFLTANEVGEQLNLNLSSLTSDIVVDFKVNQILYSANRSKSIRFGLTMPGASALYNLNIKKAYYQLYQTNEQFTSPVKFGGRVAIDKLVLDKTNGEYLFDLKSDVPSGYYKLTLIIQSDLNDELITLNGVGIIKDIANSIMMVEASPSDVNWTNQDVDINVYGYETDGEALISNNETANIQRLSAGDLADRVTVTGKLYTTVSSYTNKSAATCTVTSILNLSTSCQTAEVVAFSDTRSTTTGRSTFKFTKSGIYEFNVEARNTASGKISTSSFPIIVKIDKVVPYAPGGFMIGCTRHDVWGITDVTCNFNAADTLSGVSYFGQKSYKPGYESTTTTYRNYANGVTANTWTTDTNLRVLVQAYDKAGNLSVWSNYGGVKIDKTAPSCTSSGGSTSWQNNSVTLTGTCSDSGSGCTGNVTKTYTANCNYIGDRTPGIVYDNVGNYRSCSANQTVKIDKTAPYVSVTCSGYSTFSKSCSDSGGSGLKSCLYTSKDVGYCNTNGRWISKDQRTYTARDYAGNVSYDTATCNAQLTSMLC